MRTSPLKKNGGGWPECAHRPSGAIIGRGNKKLINFRGRRQALWKKNEEGGWPEGDHKPNGAIAGRADSKLISSMGADRPPEQKMGADGPRVPIGPAEQLSTAAIRN